MAKQPTGCPVAVAWTNCAFCRGQRGPMCLYTTDRVVERLDPDCKGEEPLLPWYVLLFLNGNYSRALPLY